VPTIKRDVSTSGSSLLSKLLTQHIPQTPLAYPMLVVPVTGRSGECGGRTRTRVGVRSHAQHFLAFENKVGIAAITLALPMNPLVSEYAHSYTWTHSRAWNICVPARQRYSVMM
jgi:hypothetical protein